MAFFRKVLAHICVFFFLFRETKTAKHKHFYFLLFPFKTGIRVDSIDISVMLYLGAIDLF